MINDNKIKHIFFDLDGTLLNNNLELKENTILGLKKIIDSNIGLSIVSARMLKSILAFFNKINIEFSYISALKGSIIYNHLDSALENLYRLDKKLIEQIINFSLKNNLVLNVFTIDNVFISGYSDDPGNKKYQKSMSPKYLKDINFQDDIFLIELILENRDHLKNIKDNIKKTFENKISISDGGYNCLEINKNGIDKGKSLEYIANKLNIKLENTLAIGDSETDISMMDKAGIAIGMKNGDRKLLSKVHLVTKKDNDENGAIEFLLDLLKIRY